MRKTLQKYSLWEIIATTKNKIMKIIKLLIQLWELFTIVRNNQMGYLWEKVNIIRYIHSVRYKDK